MSRLVEIRDERAMHANTASRVGTALIDMLLFFAGGFLSRLQPDTAQGKITFADGAKSDTEYAVGEFLSGLSGNGGIFRIDADGKTYIEADKMYIRMKAYFDTVEIRKYIHSGGNRIASLAGIKCVRVEYYDASDNLIENPGNAAYFRCYFRAVEDDIEITNDFVAGDLAYCKDTTADNGDFDSHHYWRLVLGKSHEVDENGFHYIDLSNTTGEYQSGSDIPKAQDDIIQLGNTNDTTRQGAIVEFAGGDDAPSYKIYQGINNFSLEDKNVIGLGYDSQTARAYLNVYGDAYIGAADGTTYVKYNQATKELDIKAKVKVGSTLEDGRPINDLGTQDGNLLLNSGFTGEYETEDVVATDEVSENTPMWSDPLKYWDATNLTVADNSNTTSGKCAMLAEGTLTQTLGTLKAGWYMLSLVGNVTNLSVTLGGIAKPITPTSTWARYEFSFEVSADVNNAVITFNGTATIGDLMLTEGTISREWTPSERDNNKSLEKYYADRYLREAIQNGNTEILGGLILSQLIKVGMYRDNVMSQETGGMSGLFNTKNSPFLWGGGTMEEALFAIRKYMKDPTYQATEEEVAQMAQFVVTHGGRAILNDVILRGYIYALGGVFKGMLDIGNGNFHVNEDGSASLAGGNITINSNGDVDMQNVHAENGVFEGAIKAKNGLSYGTMVVSIANGNINITKDFITTSLPYTVTSDGFISPTIQISPSDTFIRVTRDVDYKVILALPEEPNTGQMISVSNIDRYDFVTNTAVYLEGTSHGSAIVPGGHFENNSYVSDGKLGGPYLQVPTNSTVQLIYDENSPKWYVTSKFNF